MAAGVTIERKLLGQLRIRLNENCTLTEDDLMMKIVLDAAVKAGAPEGIISWIDVPGLELTNLLMKEAN